MKPLEAQVRIDAALDNLESVLPLYVAAARDHRMTRREAGYLMASSVRTVQANITHYQDQTPGPFRPDASAR